MTAQWLRRDSYISLSHFIPFSIFSLSDPFHTGSSTGNFPGFFDFWYCRTNSVRSESFSDSAAGENPYCRFCTFAKLIFATSQTCRIIPQISPFLPSEKAQLVSLAEIAISLQIKRPIGRHRSVRTVRSIQNFPVRSIQICDWKPKKCTKTKTVVMRSENRVTFFTHSPLTNSAHFRIPTFRCHHHHGFYYNACGMGLRLFLTVDMKMRLAVWIFIS